MNCQVRLLREHMLMLSNIQRCQRVKQELSRQGFSQSAIQMEFTSRSVKTERRVKRLKIACKNQCNLFALAFLFVCRVFLEGELRCLESTNPKKYLRIKDFYKKLLIKSQKQFQKNCILLVMDESTGRSCKRQIERSYQ